MKTNIQRSAEDLQHCGGSKLGNNLSRGFFGSANLKPNDAYRSMTALNMTCTLASGLSSRDIYASKSILDVDEEDQEQRLSKSALWRTSQVLPSPYTSNNVFSTRKTLADAHDGEINDILVSNSGNFFAAGGSDNTVRIFDTNDGKLRKVLKGPSKNVFTIDLSPVENDQQLVLGADTGIFIWKIKSGKLKEVLTGHKGPVHSAKFCPDGYTVVSTGYDRTLKVWDIKKCAVSSTADLGSKCHHISVFDHGRQWVTAHHDCIKIWDSATSSVSMEAKTFHNGPVTSVDISQCGKYILTNSRDNTMKLIDSRMHEVIQTYEHESYSVKLNYSKSVFSPSAKYVAAGGHDGTLFVWDTLGSNLVTRVANKHNKAAPALSWKHQFLISGSHDKSICVWREKGDESRFTSPQGCGSRTKLEDVDLSVSDNFHINFSQDNEAEGQRKFEAAL